MNTSLFRSHPKKDTVFIALVRLKALKRRSHLPLSLSLPPTPENKLKLRKLRAAEQEAWEKGLPASNAVAPHQNSNSSFSQLLLLLLLVVFATTTPLRARDLPPGPTLKVLSPASNGLFRLEASPAGGLVYSLQSSTNLQTWSEIARTHDALHPFTDLTTALSAARFYRLTAFPRTDQDDWKNQVTFPQDPFAASITGASDEVSWIKFAVLLNDLSRVHFQDSRKYPFHYDFATKRLQPFLGMAKPDFDLLSLRTNNQQVVLGALLFPPNPFIDEVGIQFVGLDPYPREFVLRLLQLVQSTVASSPFTRALYLPTYEQNQAAQTHRSFFEAAGFDVASLDRWLPGNTSYSLGWAIGRLMIVPSHDINPAFLRGELLPGDILLTDALPAEIPILAGVATLEPATPNSHVAILARSFGIPMAHLKDSSLRSLALSLHRRLVVFRVGDTSRGRSVDLFPLDPYMDPALKAEIFRLKAPPEVQITPKATLGSYVRSTEGLHPSDIKFFGGKAANFGILRQSVPSNSPVSLALSFDLWDAFMDQTLPSGKSLRQEIASRLSGFTYPPYIPHLNLKLAEVRKLITDTAKFSPALQQVITNSLVGFDPLRKIRFRSSTNVEDSEQFTGAGLYDSYSGCLADDLDNDTSDPSHCDPSEKNERGVFRAIQRVYGSFYNNNAFLERLRHDIPEHQVAMGVLVHYSSPDEFEMANGVATVRYQVTPGNTNILATLVTQLGATSVTNPDNSARPEIIDVRASFGSTWLYPKQGSSLTQLGQYVLNFQAEYKDLFQLLVAASDQYRRTLAKNDLLLDFEYKKLQPGVLQVKQIREIPEPKAAPQIPYLLKTTNAFRVIQSEYASVFDHHRLKCDLTLAARNLLLHPTNLTTELFASGALTIVNGRSLTNLSGPPADYPQAAFLSGETAITNQWTLYSEDNRQRYTLITQLETQTTDPERRILNTSDLRLRLKVDYDNPLPIIDHFGRPTTTSSHQVVFEPIMPPDTLNTLVERDFISGQGLYIQTRYYLAKRSVGDLEEKTAPLFKWDSTQIIGLISQPITLKGYYSQTYGPSHHNFSEDFIFDPWLEEGLSNQIKAELAAANIRFIWTRTDNNSVQIQILGLDGRFRSFGSERP